METKVFSVNTVATFSGYTITEIVYTSGRSLYRVLDAIGNIVSDFTSYVEALFYVLER